MARARFELRLYETEAEALDTTAAALDMRSTALLRSLAALDYCNRERWMLLGDDRCARVIVSDELSYRMLWYQIEACRRHQSQCEAALAKLWAVDAVCDAAFAGFDANRHIGTQIEDLADFSMMVAWHYDRDSYYTSRCKRVGMRVDPAVKRNLHAAAACVGASMSDLLRALVAIEADSVARYGKTALLESGHVYLDATVLGSLASDVRYAGYVYNDVARELSIAAAYASKLESGNLSRRIANAAAQLADVDKELGRIAGDMGWLLAYPSAQLRRIDRASTGD